MVGCSQAGNVLDGRLQLLGALVELTGHQFDVVAIAFFLLPQAAAVGQELFQLQILLADQPGQFDQFDGRLAPLPRRTVLAATFADGLLRRFFLLRLVLLELFVFPLQRFDQLFPLRKFQVK